MPPEDFQKAVDDILQAVIFENWLRFYFIVEEPHNAASDQEAALRIELPEKSLENIRRLYPQFLPLAENLNNRNVDFETSRRAVLTFVLDHLDGKKMPRNMAQSVFSSSTFQIALQLFHTWAQMHEEQLDQRFLDFEAWLKLFGQWREGKAATELAKKLKESLNGQAAG